MNPDADVILQRTEYHLRTAKRVALDTNDVPAFRAIDDAITTVQDALKELKREQGQGRRTAAPNRTAKLHSLQSRGTRQSALNELAETWRGDIADWKQRRAA